MASLFERYVSKSLSRAASAYGIDLHLQKSMYLDRTSHVKCYPDLQISLRQEPISSTILDTKYKASFEKDTINTADAYQMLAYMVASGSKNAWLIYPNANKQKNEKIRSIEISVGEADYWIHQIAVDLESEPEMMGEDLLQQILFRLKLENQVPNAV
ncbi:MAG: 5-methylcytosine restriction system specificity protein McrC [Oligoflexus sp.]